MKQCHTLFALSLLSVVISSSLTARAQPGSVFHGCPEEGDAAPTTQTDPELNRLKNRTEIPHSFEKMQLATLIDLEVPAGASKRHRDQWLADTLAKVQHQEQRTVQVEGYLVAVKQEGKESCNCHSTHDRDFHMWLTDRLNGDRRHAVVIEISPRIRARHPTWQIRLLRKRIDNGLLRVSGWLMLDLEHPEQLGKTRATLWEIHPILKIEVQRGNGWREL